MKFIKILSLFILVSTTLKAQISAYFDSIRVAESFIIKDEFCEAANTYQLVLQKYKSELFLKDLHNALLSAYYCKNLDLFRNAAHLYCNYDMDFKKVIANYESFEQPYLTIIAQNIKQKPIDTFHCDFITKLHYKDQYLREQDPHYQDKLFKIKIGKQDSLNMLELIEYLKMYNFRKESEICNINIVSLPALSFCLVPLHNSSPEYINNHKILEYSLFPLLKDKIFEARLHPQIYSQLMDRYLSSQKDKNPIYGVNSYIVNNGHVYSIPMETIQSNLDSMRSTIFLDDYKTFHQKIAYQLYRNNGFYLIYPFLLMDLNLPQEHLKTFFKYKIPKFK